MSKVRYRTSVWLPTTGRHQGGMRKGAPARTCCHTSAQLLYMKALLPACGAAMWTVRKNSIKKLIRRVPPGPGIARPQNPFGTHIRPLLCQAPMRNWPPGHVQRVLSTCSFARCNPRKAPPCCACNARGPTGVSFAGQCSERIYTPGTRRLTCQYGPAGGSR